MQYSFGQDWPFLANYFYTKFLFCNHQAICNIEQEIFQQVFAVSSYVHSRWQKSKSARLLTRALGPTDNPKNFSHGQNGNKDKKPILYEINIDFHSNIRGASGFMRRITYDV